MTADTNINVTEIANLMRDADLRRNVLFVTPKGLAELRKFKPACTEWTNHPMPLDGIEARVVPELKKRIPKSLDRFAEYDERDMDWAVPAGLAEWVDVDVDAMVMRMSDAIDRMCV